MDGVVSGTGIAPSLARRRAGRVLTVDDRNRLGKGMGDGGRDRTGEFGSIVGPRVEDENSIELDDGDNIDGGLNAGIGIFDSVEVRVVGGVWLRI